VILGVALVALLVVAVRSRPPDPLGDLIDEPASAPPPKGELSLTVLPGVAPDLKALLSFRNAGDVPVNVDGDLVFFTHVFAFGDKGEIEWVTVGGAPALRAGEVAERVVTLSPGESVERVIDLREGFRAFRAIRMWVNVDGDWRDSGQASEVVRRLPVLARPSRIAVEYGDPHPDEVGGLCYYTGVGYEQLDLYDGHLRADAVVPAAASP
jgi:hypothetical protein